MSMPLAIQTEHTSTSIVRALIALTALLLPHAAGIGSALLLHRRPKALRVAAAPIALAGLWLVVVQAL